MLKIRIPGRGLGSYTIRTMRETSTYTTSRRISSEMHPLRLKNY